MLGEWSVLVQVDEQRRELQPRRAIAVLDRRPRKPVDSFVGLPRASEPDAEHALGIVLPTMRREAAPAREPRVAAEVEKA